MLTLLNFVAKLGRFRKSISCAGLKEGLFSFKRRWRTPQTKVLCVGSKM